MLSELTGMLDWSDVTVSLELASVWDRLRFVVRWLIGGGEEEDKSVEERKSSISCWPGI